MSERSQDVSIIGDSEVQVTSTTDGSKERLDTAALIVGTVTPNPRSGTVISEKTKNGGSSAMNVDGSVTPVSFKAAPPSGKTWYVYSVTVTIEDNSISWKKFGGTGAGALTNGTDFNYKENGASATTLVKARTTAGLIAQSSTWNLDNKTTDLFWALWDFFNNHGASIQLNYSDTDYFEVVVNDDLTGLDRFEVVVKAYEVDEV